MADELEISDDWLRDFYKECGREVTLSYTTLNQMKNWAIVVQGTIIAAVAAFGRSVYATGTATAPKEIGTAIVVGAVLAHLFTIRFMIRSILCYINLLRWNILQAAIVQLKLPLDASTDLVKRQAALREKIQQYYHDWASPIPRGAQIASCLKLGFGLLLALPTALVIWGAFAHWDVPWVRGLTVLAIAGTLIEFFDFLTSRFFDTPKRAAKRRNKRPIFPAPSGTPGYIVLWVANVGVSSWIVLGTDQINSFAAHRMILIVVVACALYLALYVLGTGFAPRPEKLRPHLRQLLAGLGAITALSVLVSFNRIAVLVSTGAGVLLMLLALFLRRGKGDKRSVTTQPAGGEQSATPVEKTSTSG
ncbi:MAG TPA: hypothetical protein VHD56_02715 [Tepidisphaeraceae bacterium]|nr:hypothetical protein [Tepidisphaeraceae bacterium]